MILTKHRTTAEIFIDDFSIIRDLEFTVDECGNVEAKVHEEFPSGAPDTLQDDVLSAIYKMLLFEKVEGLIIRDINGRKLN